MLDFDLAAMYETETKVFNQSVKRNSRRFPEDFMFQLSRKEWNNLRSQIVTSRLQLIDLKGDDTKQGTNSSGSQHGGSRYLPYAFTEQVVAMLSGILNSDRAIQMNPDSYRGGAFVEQRKVLLIEADFKGQLKELKERVGNHEAHPTLPKGGLLKILKKINKSWLQNDTEKAVA